MCNNIIVLWFFIILKIIAILILPIIIIIKRKKQYVNILIIVDILLLLFFLICNLFTINKCVYNSNLDGIERTAYYTCNNEKIYMNSFGSSMTSVSIAISTLYDNNINPVQILNFYKEDNSDLCNMKFDINSIFSSVTKRYGAITLTNINSDQIKDEIKNGGIVIVEVSAKEGSKLTCDHDYIVIYNISLNGNLMYVSPASTTTPYVCSYSSRAYGSTIDYSNNNVSLEELTNEAVNYYLIKKV